MSETYYADLLRHGTVAGHDAGPDDYDAALRDLAEVRAWALHQRLDRVAALATGMVSALKLIDPRDPIPFDRRPSVAATSKPSRKALAR